MTNGATHIIENINTFRLSGNIYVRDGSTLIIRNTTFLMNPDSYHKYNVSVNNNSKLRIENSVFSIDENSINPYWFISFMIENSSTLEIINSSIIFAGFFIIKDSNFTGINSLWNEWQIGEGTPRWYIDSSNVYFHDCELNDFMPDFDEVMTLLGDTELIAINTFFEFDYVRRHMRIANNSHVSLYGVTIATQKPPYFSKPFDVIHDTSWVNIYRWLNLNVTDLLGIPLGNTRVNVKNITNDHISTPPQYILDYINRGANDFNLTNSEGFVVIPLMSDNLTYSSMPWPAHYFFRYRFIYVFDHDRGFK